MNSIKYTAYKGENRKYTASNISGLMLFTINV